MCCVFSNSLLFKYGSFVLVGARCLVLYKSLLRLFFSSLSTEVIELVTWFFFDKRLGGLSPLGETVPLGGRSDSRDAKL